MAHNIQEYFCNYEQSKALKELGFDGECISWFEMYEFNISSKLYNYNDISVGVISAPLKSQAFEFFREKYNLNGQIAFCEYGIKTENGWRYTLDNPTKKQFWSNKFNDYKEAESACIDELIELVKNEKKT